MILRGRKLFLRYRPAAENSLFVLCYFGRCHTAHIFSASDTTPECDQPIYGWSNIEQHRRVISQVAFHPLQRGHDLWTASLICVYPPVHFSRQISSNELDVCPGFTLSQSGEFQRVEVQIADEPCYSIFEFSSITAPGKPKRVHNDSDSGHSSLVECYEPRNQYARPNTESSANDNRDRKGHYQVAIPPSIEKRLHAGWIAGPTPDDKSQRRAA